MYDPNENRFIPIDDVLAAKFANPEAALTPVEAKQREWTRLSEGETVNVKGINFRVHEIGESRVVLKPTNKAEFAGK